MILKGIYEIYTSRSKSRYRPS